MYHPHIYVFGWFHVAYIHLDVSSTYIRFWWVPCRLHTSWCIIHIYAFLVGSMSLTYILMYHLHIYIFGGVHVAYIHLDVSSTYIRFWWGSCRLHTSWCIIHIYTFLVGSMSLTYILMYHLHIYIFGGVHVAYIHLDVSSTYIRFWWGSCRFHTSWCIIHIYTFLVRSMSLTYILMYHPHIYVFGGVHAAYIHLDVSSTYVRFWWGPCRLHTSWCIIHIYIRFWWGPCRLHTPWCIIYIYTFLVGPISLTYILMYHPHIYVFGGVHVAYIHLDVSFTYIRFWWGPCRLHTSWCIIHIYTFLVRFMSLTYILMYHPHIYDFGGVHVAYIHIDVSSTYIRFWWGPCLLHTYWCIIYIYTILVRSMSLTYILMYHPHIYVFGGVHILHISWCIIYMYTFLVRSMSLTYILMYHPHIYVFGEVHVAYIHLDVSSTYIRFWWGPCRLHTYWCFIHTFTFLVRSMSLTYILMYHLHIYDFGEVHVSCIHLDVSFTYIRFWWGPCRLHTSWCIIHIYTFLVGSMSLTYILIYHPHIYVIGGVHVTYIHLDVSSTYIRFLWGQCRLHTSW
jgi:hypothetical protein